MPAEEQHWQTITKPPLDERTGEHRWTQDAAKRLVGHQVEHPVSVQEKVARLHDLARDEEVPDARPWPAWRPARRSRGPVRRRGGLVRPRRGRVVLGDQDVHGRGAHRSALRSSWYAE
ncbi:DUF6192 family protein [Nonomuraea thailandensis]|uniref:DUF6192 family protein n=1 Tax=Nonomuraea thailandensis TaxID=1188745 RepID=UPI003556329B